MQRVTGTGAVDLRRLLTASNFTVCKNETGPVVKDIFQWDEAFHGESDTRMHRLIGTELDRRLAEVYGSHEATELVDDDLWGSYRLIELTKEDMADIWHMCLNQLETESD